MISQEEMSAVSKHSLTHQMGMCTCPCFDALVKVSKAIGKERELMVKMGSVSPTALAALIGSDVSGLPPQEESDGDDGMGIERTITATDG